MQTETDKPCGKREARKQDRQQAILAIAQRSFLEHGYAGTSMSAIAAELGGSKATLWRYFRSKEALFEAVVDEATSAYRRQVADLLRPSSDVRATVLAFARGFLTKIVSREACQLHRLVAAEAGRSPEVGAIFARVPQRTRQLLADFFTGAMAAGQLRRGDPLAAAQVLTYLCMGLQQRILWGGPDATAAEVEAEAHNATEIFLRAYAPE
ncbi:TetR/AcrR family transcriptional regulator [Sphingomonas sp. ac-8]|uniref:TetR/AcrR family transcriptional regulator n=1 Tax=Sphingomonas sp. ac-8 TaxID=3242977 RepID=UPI003A810258